MPSSAEVHAFVAALPPALAEAIMVAFGAIMTPEGVCAAKGISLATLGNLRRAGKAPPAIQARGMGSPRLFARADVAAWLAAQAEG